MSFFNSTGFGVASLIAASGIIGGAIGLSPQAEATPLSFVQALNNRGIMVYDADAAIGTGLAICDTLGSYNGADVVEAVYQLYVDVPTRATALAWVEASVEELCPQHDHRGIAA